MRDIGRVLKADNAEHVLEFERWSKELLDSLDELEARELSELGDPELLDFELEVS